MNSSNGVLGVKGNTGSEQSRGKGVDETKTVVAKRYALRFNPPSVVLEYRDASKSRLRTVKLLGLAADSDVERLATKVIRSFPRALDRRTINREQVKRLVQRLKDYETQKGTETEKSAAEAEIRGNTEEAEPEEFDLEGGGADIDLNDPNLDLNKVSIADLKAAKAKMEQQFIQHRKLPGEDGFQYDVQVDFQFAEGTGDWDSDEDSEQNNSDEE